mgnify:CR=1 FL=1
MIAPLSFKKISHKIHSIRLTISLVGSLKGPHILLIVLGSTEVVTYPCENKVCGEEYFKFPIGVSSVNFTATDRAGNSASCIFTVCLRTDL